MGRSYRVEPVSMVSEPVSMVFEPVSMVFEPVSMVLEPVSMVLEPVSMVLEPVSMVLEPVSTVYGVRASVYGILVILVSAPVQILFGFGGTWLGLGGLVGTGGVTDTWTKKGQVIYYTITCIFVPNNFVTA